MDALTERAPTCARPVDPVLNYTRAMATYLGESSDTARERVRRGEVAVFRVNGRFKIRQSELMRLIAKLEAAGAAA